MKNKNIRNVPELRFPGFEGEWEKCKVRDIATTTIGEFVIKSKQNDSYPYPVYNGGRTNTGFYDKYNNEGNKILVSARGNAGFVNIIKTRYWAGNSCYSIAIIDKNKNDVDFAYYEMKLKENIFIKNQQSATIPSVSKSAVENFELLIPLIQEQTKIGSFLATIDALISETEKELEACREQKRGMLQKMFPKNGEKVPEIRFPEFTGDWEQRKLGELADIVGGGTPSTGVSDYWDGDIDWYAPAEIAEQIYLTSSQRKITEEGYNHSSAKMLPVGTVLFTSRAGIGKTAILTQRGCTNQGFQSIVPHKSELDSYFIFSRTEELKQYGETVGAGSTFVEVSGKQMANMELMMPKTMAEQKTIGQYFTSLDNLITLHQRELDKLIELKKGFMQKMFC